jgi:hypothetical protein
MFTDNNQLYEVQSMEYNALALSQSTFLQENLARTGRAFDIVSNRFRGFLPAASSTDPDLAAIAASMLSFDKTRTDVPHHMTDYNILSPTADPKYAQRTCKRVPTLTVVRSRNHSWMAHACERVLFVASNHDHASFH